MSGPAWLTDIFAAVMITVAAYCASRWSWRAGGGGRPMSIPTAYTWSWAWRWRECW